jgi:hypothetical protein
VNHSSRFSLLPISEEPFFVHLKVVSLDLEDQVPVFTFLSDMLAQLNLQAPGFIFVAFYDSQA